MEPRAIDTVLAGTRQSLLTRLSKPNELEGASTVPAPTDTDRLVELACFGSSDSAVFELENRLRDLGSDAGQNVEAVARRLGEGWCSDELSFSAVTIGAARLQALLHRLVRDPGKRVNQTHAVGSVLLTLAPGEGHTLGLAISEHAFVSAGWRIRVLHPESVRQFTALLDEAEDRNMPFNVVCIAWSSGFLADSFQRMARVVTKRPKSSQPLIMAGGHSADQNGPMLADLGVRAVPRSGFAAVSLALESLQARPSGEEPADTGWKRAG